ncbi:helix-turn-helix domain-containing protein [Butyricicoccus porcorum]|nr:helix-turn-helix transcriptional regulator [Butyricicoccus porcorum]MCI6927033.1 helix-turn-helix transcriptional regulator [Butyricicoccus porcorum]MDD6987222.1 helix-turn-helix transcriptional regulator [Butyricicoccus porcorum]MDY4483479.1 helix-turn-helix transcriptional regulator [Butyricicoccus porcorum]
MKPVVYVVHCYGTIQIRLREYMDARHITRNALARAVNTRFEVIDKWYQGHVEKIDADVLARICFVMGCTPGDLIRYVPNEEEK